MLLINVTPQFSINHVLAVQQHLKRHRHKSIWPEKRPSLRNPLHACVHEADLQYRLPYRVTTECLFTLCASRRTDASPSTSSTVAVGLYVRRVGAKAESCIRSPYAWSTNLFVSSLVSFATSSDDVDRNVTGVGPASRTIMDTILKRALWARCPHSAGNCPYQGRWSLLVTNRYLVHFMRSTSIVVDGAGKEMC